MYDKDNNITNIALQILYIFLTSVCSFSNFIYSNIKVGIIWLCCMLVSILVLILEIIEYKENNK